MKIRKQMTIAIVFITLLLLSLSTLALSDTGKSGSGEDKQGIHALPVVSTLPSNENDQVLVNTDIRINFDINDKNYKKFRNQLETKKYVLKLNNEEVDSYFDMDQNSIIINYEL